MNRRSNTTITPRSSRRFAALLRAAQRHPVVIFIIAAGAILAFAANAWKDADFVLSESSTWYAYFLADDPSEASVMAANIANTDDVSFATARNDETYMVICELNLSPIFLGPQKDHYASLEPRIRVTLEGNCHTAFESILSEYGHTIVDRLNLPLVAKELDFQKNSRLVDQSTRSKIGFLTPANNILIVSLQPQIHVGQFDGYGVTTFPVDGIVTMVAKKINVETGEIASASETFVAKETLLQPNQSEILRIINNSVSSAIGDLIDSRKFRDVFAN